MSTALPPEQRGPATAPVAAPVPAPADPGARRPTRASAAWAATGVSLFLLLLLVIFILQNQQRVAIHYLGFNGTMPAGVAMLCAALAGGGIVAIVGGARLSQIYRQRRRARKRSQEPSRPAPTPTP